MDVLISDKGTIWALRGATLPPPPSVVALVPVSPSVPSTLYVRVTIHGQGARIALPSGWLARPSFERLVWLLLHYKVDRGVLEIGRGRLLELYGTFHDLVARLDELRATAPGELARSCFLWERLSIERLDSPRRVGLQQALAAWTRARGRIDPHELRRECGRVDGERMWLRVGRARALMMEGLPRSMRAYTACQKLAMLGRDIAEQPDDTFGQWLAQPYRRYAMAEQPSFELVEAVIAPAGGRAVRARYERLLLPWQSQSADRQRWISTQWLIRSWRAL